MRLTTKLLLACGCASALCGCGGATKAPVQFPYVRTFNSVDANNDIVLTFHDLNANLLGQSPSVQLGTANAPPDVSFVYSEATATITLANGNPGYTGASFPYAQNGFYTDVAMGSAANGYQVLPLTDTNVVGDPSTFYVRFVGASVLTGPIDVYVEPTGTTTLPGGASPTASDVVYNTLPSTANNAAAVANGYIPLPTSGATQFDVLVTAHGSTTLLFPAQPITIVGGDYYTDVSYDTGTSPASFLSLLDDTRSN